MDETKYIVGDTAAQDQKIAEEIERATRHARMAQHFENIGAEIIRADKYQRAIRWARNAVVLLIVSASVAAVGALAVRGIDKAAYDAQVEVVPTIPGPGYDDPRP